MEISDNINDYSNIEEEIINNLINGRNELDLLTATRFFESALKLAKDNFTHSPACYNLFLDSLEELGNIECNIKRRTVLWERLLSKCIDFLNQHGTERSIVDNCIDKIVTYSNEAFTAKNHALLKKAMSVSISKLDHMIPAHLKETDKFVAANLLVKKAKILRHYTFYQPARTSKIEMLQVAMRCLDKALMFNDNSWYTYLEYGKCHAEMSYLESSVTSFNDRINASETMFRKSQAIKLNVNNALPLCDLYKITFQPTPFISAYTDYELAEKNKRRYLENATLFAESIIQLFYARYDEGFLTTYILKAENLLSDAISMGFVNARVIIDLAFIKAAKGEISVGENLIKTLKSSAEAFDWNIIINDIKTLKASDDLLDKGLVLGIDNSAVWNKLGSFANKFLGDYELAIKLYEVAIHLEKSNPIPQTNIARNLIRRSPLTESDITAAEYHISNAQSNSTFRFQWWRAVREEIRQAREDFQKANNQSAEAKEYYEEDEYYEEEKEESTVLKNINKSKLSDLLKWLQFLKASDNAVERGFEFQTLINSLFRISLGNAAKSHRFRSDYEKQIDDSFFFEKEYYRVEMKWTKAKVDHDDIAAFFPKLNTKDVRGLFVSYSGFTENAIQLVKSYKKEHIVLLMDGDEIESTLKGTPTFDEAIKQKQFHFFLRDNPYYRITGQRDNVE